MIESQVIQDLSSLGDVIQQVSEAYRRDKSEIKNILCNQNFGIEAFGSHLEDPRNQPYGRRPIFQRDDVEVILMNWAPRRSSLPHDHGQSEGWVKILEGTAAHGYYNSKSHPIPRLIHEDEVACGDVIYAPTNMVHHMANPGDGQLITLHIYFPPINGMEVFDLRASRAAVVSSDCGAWWPQSQYQLVSHRSLA